MFDNEKQSQSNLECKDYVKYLGMLLDKNLSFKNHIDQIIIKISKTVGMIAKLRHFLPRKTLIQIYNSLIGPYLSYAIAVWGSADKCHINKILILQKRALHFIYFDVRHERAPRNITDLFIDTKSIHSYNTRSSASHNFYIKPSKLQIQLKAFSRLGARIWNEITTLLRDKSRSMFKSELHNILLKMLRTHDDYLNISQIGQAIKLV